jgi:hypothetical protein
VKKLGSIRGMEDGTEGLIESGYLSWCSDRLWGWVAKVMFRIKVRFSFLLCSTHYGSVDHADS